MEFEYLPEKYVCLLESKLYQLAIRQIDLDFRELPAEYASKINAAVSEAFDVSIRDIDYTSKRKEADTFFDAFLNRFGVTSKTMPANMKNKIYVQLLKSFEVLTGKPQKILGEKIDAVFSDYYTQLGKAMSESLFDRVLEENKLDRKKMPKAESDLYDKIVERFATDLKVDRLKAEVAVLSTIDEFNSNLEKLRRVYIEERPIYSEIGFSRIYEQADRTEVYSDEDVELMPSVKKKI